VRSSLSLASLCI